MLKQANRFTVGQIKGIIEELTRHLLAENEQKADDTKTSKARRNADRIKRENVALLAGEIQSMKAGGISLEQINEIIRERQMEHATPALRNYLRSVSQ